MSIRLHGPVFADTAPTFVQSIAVRGSTNAVFAGVTAIASGSSSVVVNNCDVRTNTAVFLGAMQTTTLANRGFGRPLAINSITVATTSGTGAFMVTSTDSLAIGCSIRVPWLLVRIGE
jgi:hypothetical protein